MHEHDPHELSPPTIDVLSPEAIALIYGWIRGACASAGLSPSDGQDVAQDVWLWLLRANQVRLASEKQWLRAVTQHFIHRSYRKLSRLRLREGTALSDEFGIADQIQRIEAGEVLDRLSRVLPEKERRVLTLIRKGYTIAEAARALKIPRGSRAYFGGRLVDLAKLTMGGRPSGKKLMSPDRRRKRPSREADKRKDAENGAPARDRNV